MGLEVAVKKAQITSYTCPTSEKKQSSYLFTLLKRIQSLLSPRKLTPGGRGVGLKPLVLDNCHEVLTDRQALVFHLHD